MSTLRPISTVGTVGLFPSAMELIKTYFGVPSDLSKSGVQLFILGGALAVIRQGTYWLCRAFDRTFISRTEIESHEDAHLWIKSLLGDLKGEDSLHFTVASRPWTMNGEDFDGELGWIPAPGRHLIFHQGRPILVTRSITGGTGQNIRNSVPTGLLERVETFSLATPSTSPDILHSFIEHARALFIEKDRSRTVVFSGQWQYFQTNGYPLIII